MKDVSAASRYAKALFGAAKKPKQTETVREELDRVLKVLRTDEKLWKIWNHPLVSLKDKRAGLEKAFHGLSQTTADFLVLLIKKNRLALLPQVVFAFAGLDDEARGILRAKVESAFPLSEALKKKLESGLSRWSGKTVTLDVSENARLLGGVVVKVGDKVLDGSVLNSLHKLKEQLVA